MSTPASAEQKAVEGMSRKIPRHLPWRWDADDEIEEGSMAPISG